MDISRGLITRIVDDKTLNKVTRSGISQEFLNETDIPVFRFLNQFYGEHKETPSRDAVLRSFPSFQFHEVQEPLEYFINELQESYRRNILEEKLNALSSLYLKDTKRAETLLRETLSQLNVTQKTFRDVDVAKTATDRFEAYTTRKENPGADGILSGWQTLDYQTLGWHPEEFIVLVGQKYMGKSWLLIWLAYKAAMQQERVLFVTKEMSQEALARRFDAIYASVCFDKLRRGELSDQDEMLYKRSMEKLISSSMHFMMARQGVNTIADIELKAAETDATIIFGDSIYLFDPDNSGTRYNGETAKLRAVSQACKRIAQSTGIPFVASLQAGRRQGAKDRKPTLDDIEWSNAFAQDADTAFFIQKDELDKELKRAQLHLLKSRDGDEAELFINQDFINMKFDERPDEIKPTTAVFEEDENFLFNE